MRLLFKSSLTSDGKPHRCSILGIPAETHGHTLTAYWKKTNKYHTVRGKLEKRAFLHLYSRDNFKTSENWIPSACARRLACFWGSCSSTASIKILSSIRTGSDWVIYAFILPVGVVVFLFFFSVRFSNSWISKWCQKFRIWNHTLFKHR